MPTLRKKPIVPIKNNPSSDPFDQIIFEGGLRIRHVALDKQLDLIVLVLSNGVVVKSKLSKYPKLNKADEKQLHHWNLISEGVGLEWPGLNEDLSLKGFLKGAYINAALITLQGNQESSLV
ncbi:hypothetical protein BH09BAC3_BH09BAC3_09240 [soil metagenome]